MKQSLRVLRLTGFSRTGIQIVRRGRRNQFLRFTVEISTTA